MRRNLGLVFLALVSLLLASLPAAAQARRRGAHVRVHRTVTVNVHRRGGFWRGVAVGATVAALPRGHAALLVGEQRFFHYGGAFYRPVGRGYVVVAPPVGAVIAAVPEGCAPAAYGGIGYHYCAGTYYAPAPGGFAVVEAPIGISVDELPIGCSETRELDGVEHYACEGVYYRPLDREGATWYVTVKR